MSSTSENFQQLGLSSRLLQALEEVGYETPSPIQAACIPLLMQGGDLFGQAQTGTGKTAAFALPLLDKLDLSQRHPQALVLTPTRELAIQVAEAFQTYAKHMPGFHVLPVYGGQSMTLQLRPLDRGVHVVVGTPGRVMDHLERKSLDLSRLQTLVLDEADEMLRMGFIDDVEWILKHVPNTRQTALFSATMPEPIRRVASAYLRDPKEIRIKTATTTSVTIRQRYVQASGAHKLDALTRILEAESNLDAAIIFVRTKTETVVLAEKLEARGYAAAALNGDLTQQLRERTIEQLKNNKLDIIVATDVAARGLDVARISHVINYDIPYDTEAYVHRIGRTGRAGREGTAILFVTPREMRMLRTIERATRQPIEPMPLPSYEAVVNRRVQQFKEGIVTVLGEQDLTFFHGILAQMQQEQNIGLKDLAAALAYLVQKDKPLSPSDSLPEQPAFAEVQAGPGGWVRYRVEVGRNHEVTVKNIVGAIANEGGIPSRQIGAIRLFDDFSTIELQASVPAQTINALRRVRVRQQPLNIAPDTGAGGTGGSGGYSGAPRRSNNSGGYGGGRERGERSYGERNHEGGGRRGEGGGRNYEGRGGEGRGFHDRGGERGGERHRGGNGGNGGKRHSN